MNIIQKPSPNFSPGFTQKDTLVLHQTLGMMPGCLDWLTNKVSQVSAHYLITKEGVIYQLVQNKDVAWHAGNISNPTARGLKILKPELGGFMNPNKHCIGIEFESLQGQNLTEAQYTSGVELAKSLNLPNIVEHKDIASYKADCAAGIYEEFMARLTPQTNKQTIKEQIIKLLNQL